MPEEVVRNTSFSGGIAMKYQFIHSFIVMKNYFSFRWQRTLSKISSGGQYNLGARGSRDTRGGLNPQRPDKWSTAYKARTGPSKPSVIARLRSRNTRDEIIPPRKILKGTGISISEDFYRDQHPTDEPTSS